MKTPIVFILGLILSLNLTAQKSDLLKQFKLLKEQITPVDLGRNQYEQNIEYDPENPSNVTIIIEEIDSKRGKSVEYRYEFNLSLLDKSGVRRISSSKEMKVLLRAKKDIFQLWEDGEWKGYEDELEIMAQDIDAAKQLEQTLEDILPIAETYLSSVSALPDDAFDLLEWIAQEIGNVEVGEETIDQSCTLNGTYPDIITLEQNEDGNEQTTTLSLGDLNANSLTYSIKSDQVRITAKTEKNKDFVLTEEEEESEYGDDLLIYARDPLQATQLIRALDLAIPLCDSLIQLRVPKPTTQKEALTILVKHLKNFSFNDKSYQQSLNESCEAVYKWSEEDDENVYKFLWGDLDKKSVQVEVEKEKIEISVKTTNNKNYIEVLENGALKGFKNQVIFLVPDVEAARALEVAIAVAIEQCPVQMEAKDLKWLDQSLQDISKIEEDLSQNLEAVESTDPCQLIYSITESGKSDETETYEFALEDIDLKKLELNIRGKSVELTLQTKREEKSITYTDDDQDVSYEDEIELLFSNVESGRIAILTLKALGEGCKTE